MIQFQKQAVLAAFVFLGGAGLCSTSYAQKGKGEAKPAPGPKLVGKALTITCKVTPASSSSTGVVLAQGGDQRGYSLYLKGGKPMFFVRQAGKLYTAKAPSAPSGSFTLEAHLQKGGAMTLAVNGTIVGRAKAPGLFGMQPKDGFSVGQDSTSPVGDYKAPSPLKGKVENVKVATA